MAEEVPFLEIRNYGYTVSTNSGGGYMVLSVYILRPEETWNHYMHELETI